MKAAATPPAAAIARLWQPELRGPARRGGAGKSRQHSRNLEPSQIPTPPGALVWCVHCYQVLGSARTRRRRLDLERAHNCPEKLQAGLPASPPPYN